MSKDMSELAEGAGPGGLQRVLQENTKPFDAGTSPSDTELPEVRIPGGDVSISGSARSLYEAIKPTGKMFLRDSSVCVTAEQDGVVSLEILKPAAACSRFEKFVRFVRIVRDSKGTEHLQPDVISKELAEKYLAAEERRILPVVESILNTPMITERDGAIQVLARGYDAPSRTLVAKAVDVVDVPLQTAVADLKNLLRDFQFQTNGDRSRAIASFLTPALKFGGFLKGPIPADVAEADQSQSGKTYRQQIVAAIYNDHCNVITKQEGTGVGGLDEKFSAALVQGRPFIQFDNVRGKFKFQALESFMTAQRRFPARPAYSPVVQVDPAKFMIMVSSNGYETNQDLANRSAIIRINKRVDFQFEEWIVDGEFRGHLLERVQHEQAHYLSCVFSVVREWHRQGKPRTNENGHSFREWARTLDWIVQHIFGEAPLLEGHKEAQTRAANPDLTFLRVVAVAVAEQSRLDEDLQATDIADICEQRSIIIPGLTMEKRHDEDSAKKTIGRLMARIFHEGDEVGLDGFTVGKRAGRHRPSEHHTYPTTYYTFRRQSVTKNAPTPASPHLQPSQ